MKKFIQSRSAWEIVMVSLLAFFVTVGVVMATTTIGTNINTGGSIYATSTLYVDGESTFTGNLVLNTASSTGQVKFSDITTTAASITFNSKNLTSVGDIALVTASSTGTVKFPTIASDSLVIAIANNASTTGSAIFKTATINSDTGAISFSDENLTTTGALAFATASSTGAVKFPSISSDNGYVRFTSPIDVNGMATTTLQGIVTPASTSTTPTAYCGATTAGGLLWQTATKRLCVCTGVSWVLATTTGTCQ